MRTLKILLIIVLFGFAPASCSSDKGGPPKSDEIIGFWKMEKWPKPKMNKVNPWPLPYQWFAFYEDGRFVSMMKTEDNNYTPKELSEVFDALPFKSPQYQLKGQFLVVRNPNNPGYSELWGVNLFAKDVNPLIKKGDLVMSLAGGKNGAPVYYRLLRKIN